MPLCWQAPTALWGYPLAQVVEQTTEIARSMLVEIHRQGQQLAKTDQGMQAVSWQHVPQCRPPSARLDARTMPLPV
jgi:hypothetical protein